MRRLAPLIALFLTVLLGVGIANAELSQHGGLRISFDGRFTPQELPRDHLAPVTAHIDGSIGTVDGSRPPELQRISIGLNRSGRLFTGGLPTCPASELQATSTDTALSRCRPALVGHGRLSVRVNFPNLAPIPAEGKMIALNSIVEGRPAILLHVYVSSPVKATFILTFRITHSASGTFGTVFSTKIPKLASNFGYVTDISLTMGRQYRYRGEQRSFLSASCAAPPGFFGAIFPFARGTFSFSNGQRVTSVLTRNCRVR